MCSLGRPNASGATLQGVQWHSLTHGAHVVPMAVPAEWSTEAGVKGLAPHIAVFCCTVLAGNSEPN